MVTNLSVPAVGGFILREAGADEVDRDASRRNRDPQVPGAAEDVALHVAVLGGVARRVAAPQSRLGNFLVDDAVEVLLGEEVVVAVEDDRDAGFDQQWMNGHGPAGPVLLEAVAAVRVLSAPFVERRRLAPPRLCLSVPPTRWWMNTNLNLAWLCSSVCLSHWYCSAPSVRVQLSSPPPRCAVRTRTGRARRTARRPIPRRSSPAAGRRSGPSSCCRVEAVGHGVGEIPLPHRVGPDGQAVRRAARYRAAFAVVVAQHEEQRRRVADQAEVVPLGEVLPGGRLAAGVLLGHEGVAEVDVEIGRIGQGVGQCVPVEAGSVCSSRCESAVTVNVKVLPGGRGVWKVPSRCWRKDAVRGASGTGSSTACWAAASRSRPRPVAPFGSVAAAWSFESSLLRAVGDIAFEVLVGQHAQR